MIKTLFGFNLVLIALLSLSYLFHSKLVENELLLTLYFINILAVMIIFNLAYFLKKHLREYLGYYFLSGTALKFFVFFVFVLPAFKLDGNQTKEEFFCFFIPYFLALIIETKALISISKKEQ